MTTKEQKMIDDHWNYIEKVLKEQNSFDYKNEVLFAPVLELIKFHYKSAFEHGYKHGCEATEKEIYQKFSCTDKLFIN